MAPALIIETETGKKRAMVGMGRTQKTTIGDQGVTLKGTPKGFKYFEGVGLPDPPELTYDALVWNIRAASRIPSLDLDHGLTAVA